MSLERYRIIENWTEADLYDFTEGENDEYEFKSSKISEKDLMKEIQVAASAFWNSGGGVLMVGINDKGDIDGGIDDMIGRQRLRDWVDRVVSHVEPSGPYFIKLIYGEDGSERIGPNKVVLIVAYGESNNAPHMAPDKRYYVRAGAHSDPAGHFLIESIRARRRLQKPVLRGLLRSNAQTARVIELVVMSLNETPALDVRLTFDGLPQSVQAAFDDRLPLYIPVIDRRHPFSMDASLFGMDETGFGKYRITLRLNYQDLA
ncbi:MAG: ATP-binding protein, partial [Chloroflexota bacterium]